MAIPVAREPMEITSGSQKMGLIRVLHVDDDSGFLQIAKEILELNGLFEVHNASSVEEAFEKISHEEYDAVVSDYQMSGKDGLEFLKELREKGNAIPFVIFTGKGREEVVISALNLGANQYVNKIGDPETVYRELGHGIETSVKSKRSEQALRESEKKYRSLFENMLNGFSYCKMIFDEMGKPIDFVYLEVNNAFIKLSGLKKETVIGKKVTEAIPGTEKLNPELFEIYGRVALTGKEEKFEIFFKPLNIWLSISVYSPEKGHFVAVFENITERKKAEAEIAWLASFPALNPNPVVEVDFDGNINYVNSAVVSGFPDLKKTGLNHPFLSGWEQAVAAFKNGKKQTFGRDIKIGDAWFHQQLHVVPETRQVRIYATNITEAKQAEEALKRSEVRFRDLTESISDVFFAMDNDLRYTYWNRASEKLTGISAKDAIGKSLTEVFPDVKDTEAEQFYRNVLRTKRHQTFVNKYRVGEKDFVFEIDAYPTKDGISVFTKDITERKKMMNALRESEEKYRRQFEEALDAIFVADAETGILVDCNPAACELVGRAKSEIVGIHQRILHPPEETEGEFSRTYKEHLGKKKGHTLESQVITKSGEIKDVAIKANIFTLGNKTLMQGSFRDITERKKAEESLEKEQQELDRIVDSSPIIIFYKDKEGQLIRVNKAFAEALKMRKEEFLGKTVFDLYSAKIAQGMANDDAEVLKSGLPKLGIIEQYESASGVRWVQTDKVPIFDKNGIPTGLVGFAQGITERKKAEEALRLSEEKHRAISSITADCLFSCLKAGKEDFAIDWMAGAAEKVFGYSIEEIKRRGCWKFVVTPKDMPIFEEKVAGLRPGQSSVCELRINPKDGSTRWIKVSSQVKKDSSNPTNHRLFGACRDITERKKAEEHLKESHYKMEMVNEKLRVVGGLTRHAVRNKLSAVEGNVHLARKKLAAESDALSYLSRIEPTIDQIIEIFNFAAAYERIGVEKLVYVDVEKAVEEAVMLFSDLQSVKIRNDCHGLSVLADSLLKQLFFNLIDNSLKHGKQTSQIRIYCQKENGENFRLVYEDDGVGIPYAEKPKLFNEGYSTNGGTGYGLYLIKKLTEVYGWTIQETGEPRKGAQFTITIPKKNQDNEESYQLLSTNGKNTRLKGDQLS